MCEAPKKKFKTIKKIRVQKEEGGLNLFAPLFFEPLPVIFFHKNMGITEFFSGVPSNWSVW